MKRRGFFGAIAAAFVAPAVVKALPAPAPVEAVKALAQVAPEVMLGPSPMDVCLCPSGRVEFIDVTSHDSGGSFREYLPGLRDIEHRPSCPFYNGVRAQMTDPDGITFDGIWVSDGKGGMKVLVTGIAGAQIPMKHNGFSMSSRYKVEGEDDLDPEGEEEYDGEDDEDEDEDDEQDEYDDGKGEDTGYGYYGEDGEDEEDEAV